MEIKLTKTGKTFVVVLTYIVNILSIYMLDNTSVNSYTNSTGFADAS
jgi:hypothetical protein